MTTEITYTIGTHSILLRHVTERQLACDHNFTEPCDYIKVIVDGHTYDSMRIGEHPKAGTVICGTIGGCPSITLPQDAGMRQAVLDMFGGVAARAAASIARLVEQGRREGAEYRKAQRNGLCPRCHTYCYGDCQAN